MGCFIRIDEVEPGVWFVLDHDGEPLRDSDCGPFSTMADARWALAEIERAYEIRAIHFD